MSVLLLLFSALTVWVMPASAAPMAAHQVAAAMPQATAPGDARVTLDLGRVPREAGLRAIRDAAALRLSLPVGAEGLQDSVVVQLRNVPALDALRTTLAGSPFELHVTQSGFVGVRLRRTTSQTGTVTGRVIDADSQEPLPGAAVLIVGTTRGDAADPNGRFTIARVPEGEQIVEAQLIGYETAQETIAVQSGETVEIEIELSVATVGLDGVTVVAETEASRIERSAQAVAVLDLVEERVQTADLGEVLARTEGVAVQRAGGLGSGTRVSLNGLSDDQIRFFFNGLPLGLAGYPFGIANIPVNLIERAEVYKGVVPIRFGADALGGAINIVAPGGAPGLSGSASYQVGSFGTHRTVADIGYQSPETGLFVRGGGFYDFARNDYNVDVFVADNLGRRTEVTVPRFNDRYRSGAVNVSAGVRNRAWADELSVNAYAVDFARQVQNNPTMSGLPFGEAESFGTTYGVNLTYEATLSDRLSLDIVGGYVYSERRLFDVANCRYNWFGECIIETREPGEVIRNRGTDRTTIDDDAFARFNATWRIGDRHLLRFSTAPSFNWRTGRDALVVQGTDLLAGDARLTTWVSGLEYQFGGPGGRIENRFFVKDYRRIATSAFGVPLTTGSVLDAAPADRSETNLYGIGNVMRIAWTDRLATKVSYEWATRLPQPDEFFGDGVFITPNTDLEPERSHNANLEVSLTSPVSAPVSWSLQANGFIRATDNLIRFIAVDEVLNAFDNVVSATSVGFEASGRTALFAERLTLNANTTYQAFRNTSSDGFYALFEGDRIPNEPYFFANASSRYWMRSPVRPGDRLSVFASTRYVHSFFRTWESAGQRAFASEIPEQVTFAAGTTYESTMGTTRWSLTAEIQNLTNATVFDFFGVQRPGRAFFVKLTTQL